MLGKIFPSLQRYLCFPQILHQKHFFTGKATLSGKVLLGVFYVKGKAMSVAMPWLYLRINTSFNFFVIIQKQLPRLL